ncbi:MAG: ribonucleotide reductase N-terminal alpha domain-containing protein [Gammaproteobacteria bacterium]|nr:ribonucleotide reductase N-terminal alpha domain-containing protein [Gammaproteobacteria bacterium]
MKTAVQVNQVKAAAIEFQAASIDIWDKKYRLKSKSGEVLDETMDDTYKRVAAALAEVEAEPERWYDTFLWALRHGAVPAGRIVSNAGARHHKPATSTINCTVSGTVADSMHDILDKVHEAGLTLKAGCGIGYEFSTLRPKGAYVSGAGAYTSGPLSFMDIYDKMCFTVSSAGGRRGAQMGTFDVGHPDVLDFIRSKREDGRLRQFNLSLLVTDDFISAVREDAEWALAFPLDKRELEQGDIDLTDGDQVLWRDWPADHGYVQNEHGLIACRVYKRMPARRLWDMIMSSTYDFAEPGFVLVDRVNDENNNWFDENIRATNPCVTADTWVQTGDGPRQVSELLGQQFVALVDGQAHKSTAAGFFHTATKAVLSVETAGGYSLRLTDDHQLQRVVRFDEQQTVTEWCAAGELKPGDRLLLNDHRRQVHWRGASRFGRQEGYLLGLLRSGGSTSDVAATISVPCSPVVANAPCSPMPDSEDAVMSAAVNAARTLGAASRAVAWQSQAEHGELRLTVPGLQEVAGAMDFDNDRAVTPAIERASSSFYRGFLQACFDIGAELLAGEEAGPAIRYTDLHEDDLAAIQRMLLRFGIVSRRSGQRTSSVTGCCLWISGANLAQFARLIGFSDAGKTAQLEQALLQSSVAQGSERFVARVKSIEPAGAEDVYDCQVPGINAFDANGLHAHNCGEQPLPPYGSCLLGSVNLTKFVEDAFTDQARFNWEEFRKVVKVFTRMLDNVVEINGLPLEQQRQEIYRKRRHGMGFLGLGSTLTMLRLVYGEDAAVEFTETVARELALAGWETALELALEKGPAPIMLEEFQVTPEMLRRRPEMARDGWQIGDKIPGRILHARYSRYMQRIAAEAPQLAKELERVGARFTHHSSIAPTGTISLSLANNASNGIEPSFAHHYFRNVIREGRKTKEKVDVFSFELLAYRTMINPRAMPASESPDEQLPAYFTTAENITPKEHVDIQAAAQSWTDSSISKTANVPTDFPYDEFKDIYLYAHEKGLKGCTTFRFNPEAFQGVLVKEKDLQNTNYVFVLEDGTEVSVRGDQEVEYDGEVHTAANLFDALKEGYYGKF